MSRISSVELPISGTSTWSACTTSFVIRTRDCANPVGIGGEGKKLTARDFKTETQSVFTGALRGLQALHKVPSRAPSIWIVRASYRVQRRAASAAARLLLLEGTRQDSRPVPATRGELLEVVELQKLRDFKVKE